VTDLPNVEIGDEVVLIGEQGGESMTAYDLADAIGTIPYEVTCAISARVPRLLID
jgi:alanine racemase